MTENERIDTVNDNLKLIQYTDGLTFGTDALLLGGYPGGGYRRAIELGAGTGIVSMLLLSRNKAERVSALEIQADYTELIKRNARLNGLSERLLALNTDIRDYKLPPDGAVDLVVTNPPYMKTTSGERNESERKYIARHEAFGTILDFCMAAKRCLRFGGSFAVVYRTDRLTELLAAMRECALEAKRMTFVHADSGSSPSMVLIEARLGGRVGLYLTPPLILYRDREHTEPSDAYEFILQNGEFPAVYHVPKGAKSNGKYNREEQG